MAYQTGQATGADNLKTIIETFASAHGWTLSAGILSKGDSHVRLTLGGASNTRGSREPRNEDANNRELLIEGAGSADFSAKVCDGYGRIWVEAESWPATYHLFGLANPNTLICVISYDNVYCQWLAWGELEKYGNYVGGDWFGGSLSRYKDVSISYDQSGNNYPDSSSGALFWYGEKWSRQTSFCHAELDGGIWQTAANFISYARPLTGLQPNTYNTQATLIPLWVWLPRPETKISLLGRVSHCRVLRIDNYALGDIITIGPDRWMVFPWYLKNSDIRDGRYNALASGTFGWAIRYDGP